MNFKYLSIALLAATLCSPSLADSGGDLFEENCAACHGGDARGDDRIAPPIFAVKGHYLSAYPDRESFIKAVSTWAKKPDANLARMPGALRRFGEMTAIELSDEEAEKIASFIYDGQFDRPGW